MAAVQKCKNLADRDVLDSLAASARQAAEALAEAAARVRCAADGADLFAALRHFETARSDCDRRAGAVVCRAVSAHRYF